MSKHESLYFILLISLINKISSQFIEYWVSEPALNKMFVQYPLGSFGTDVGNNPYTINIDSNQKYQQMDGYGASLTDASAWLFFYKLSANKRAELLEKLFGKSGINLSLLRQPIGASDFSWESWSFSDTNNIQDDFSLNSFSLWREDAYIRPILDQALAVDKGRIKIFASPWSPPAWMKTQKNLFGSKGGSLRKDCYSVYADYFVKFIKEYKNKGSPVYAITPQNEPQYAPSSYPGMLMSAQEQTEFVRDHLGPKIKSAGLDTKIVIFDHNFDAGGITYVKNVMADANARSFIAGSGYHTYTGASHTGVSEIHNLYPDKDIWFTEAGFGTWIGDNFSQFQDQMMHLIRSAVNWSKGFMMWNIALDQNSGPKLAGVDSTNSNRGLVTIRSDLADTWSYEMGYYSLGHFSKFVQPGARRIQSTTFQDDLETVAFLNPDNTLVVVVSNRRTNQKKIKLRWNFKAFELDMPGASAITFKFNAI